jgi:hypothetical protein
MSKIIETITVPTTPVVDEKVKLIIESVISLIRAKHL